jgi:hypothetical protein
VLAGMSDDAAKFRKQAEGCREQAAKSLSPLDKEAWLRVAEEWLRLAAEGRQGEYGCNASLLIQDQPRRPAQTNSASDCPDDDAAKKEASEMFADMAQDISSQLQSTSDWQIEVGPGSRFLR